MVSRLNAWIKARSQERRVNKSLAYYYLEAKKRNLSILEEVELGGVLRKRLASRGLFSIAKKKDALHIFLAFPLTNWEGILPKALEPFGKVTTFEWRSLGFNDLSMDWLKHRDSMNAAMIETFRNVHKEQSIDVIVGYLSGYNTSPNILTEMSKAGVVIFNFC